MSVQHIEVAGQPFVIIPKHEYERLAAGDEMARDVADFDRIMAERDPNAEGFPIEFSEALFDAHDNGACPIPLWREYRGLTQQELATKVDVSQAYISDIESGKKDGSISVMKKVAECLQCDLDDLV